MPISKREILNEPLLLARILGKDKVKHSIHEEWIRDLWKKGNSTIQGHRGSYKSTCNVIGVIWGLLFDPDKTILIARKSASEASKMVSEIMQMYSSIPLRRLYYETFNVEDPRDLTKWSEQGGMSLSTRRKVQKERTIESGGVGQFKTGQHYDLIVGDDLVTVEDRYSEAEREHTKQFVRELQNLLNPDGVGIKFRGTPWHEEDAFTIMPPAKKYPVKMAFIPEWTKEKLEEQKRILGDSLYAANYDLLHIADEKKVFSYPQFTTVTDDLYLIAYLDPAFSEELTNDCTALTVGGFVDGKYKIKFGCIWQEEIDKIYDNVEDVCRNLGVSILVVEDNAAQKAVANEFKTNRKMNTDEVYSHKNKHFRIISYAKKQWADIEFDETLRDSPYIQQIEKYNIYVKKKDAPDSLAGLIQYFEENERPSAEILLDFHEKIM